MLKRKLIGLLILVLLCFIVPNDASGQDATSNNKLLYVVIAAENREFLMPYIHTQLNKLVNVSTHKKLFEKATSLNEISRNQSDQDVIKNLYTDMTNSRLVNSKADTIKLNAFQDLFHSYNKFLRININPLNSLLEFQFILYDVSIDTTKTSADPKKNHVGSGIVSTSSAQKTLPTILTFSQIASSIFIDPTSTTYKQDILIGIKEVFKDANVPPRPMISFNSYLYKELDTVIHIPFGYPVEFIASEVDEDSPKDQMKYYWEITSALKKAVFITDPFNKSQKVTINPNDTCIVSLKITDGITSSTKKFMLVAIEKPEIQTSFEDQIDLYSFGNKYDKNSMSDQYFLHWANRKLAYSMGEGGSSNKDLLILNKNPLIPNDAYQIYKLDKERFQLRDSTEDSRHRIRMVKDLTKTEQDNGNYFVYDSDDTTELYSKSRDKNRDGIEIPTIEYFMITRKSYELKSNAFFSIHYHKLSRCYFLYRVGYLRPDYTDHNYYSQSIEVGLGARLIKMVAIELSAGPAYNANNDLKRVEDLAMIYKANLTIGIYDIPQIISIHGILGVAYNNLAFQFTTKEYGTSPGFGASLSIGDINSFLLGNMRIYGMCYPTIKKAQVIYHNYALIKIWEAGVSFNLNFERHRKSLSVRN